MRRSLTVVVIIGGLTATSAGAHRLDEYLQATTLAVEKSRVQGQISLSPGVAVFPAIFAELDRDRDGALSAAEQAAYAQRVLNDLTLSSDGKRLPLRLTASSFAAVDALSEGRGDIRLDFESDLPAGGAERKLTFENHHQRPIGAYLVNALAPRDADIRIVAQNRNHEQSRYELHYSDASAAPTLLRPFARTDLVGWLGTAAIALVAGLALSARRIVRAPAVREKS